MEPSLWPLLVSLYNSYGLMASPHAAKVRKVDYITIQMWKSFLKEAEAVGGDHANQLATLVIKTVNDLAHNAKNASFADSVIRHMAKLHLLLTAIKESQSEETMGSFRALLEQALRKFEGKPGDSRRVMLGRILEKAKTLSKNPEHITSYVEHLFDWVVLRIAEVKKATQSFYRDLREGYSPLSTLDDLIGPQKEKPAKKEYQPADKGKRSRQPTACRFCNNLRDGKYK